jgi:hypothetical protein
MDKFNLRRFGKQVARGGCSSASGKRKRADGKLKFHDLVIQTVGGVNGSVCRSGGGETAIPAAACRQNQSNSYDC